MSARELSATSNSRWTSAAIIEAVCTPFEGAEGAVFGPVWSSGAASLVGAKVGVSVEGSIIGTRATGWPVSSCNRNEA